VNHNPITIYIDHGCTYTVLFGGGLLIFMEVSPCKTPPPHLPRLTMIHYITFINRKRCIQFSLWLSFNYSPSNIPRNTNIILNIAYIKLLNKLLIIPILNNYITYRVDDDSTHTRHTRWLLKVSSALFIYNSAHINYLLGK